MDKVYIGSGKVITTQYGEMMKLSFTEEDVKKLQYNLKNGWVNINVNKKKVPGLKGSTHYGTLDTWKPDVKRTTVQEAKEIFQEKTHMEDLPF